MEFTAMDAIAYRSLGEDEYAQRRSEVIGLAKELPEDATVEQAEAIDVELGLIDAEDERRAKLADIEQRNRSKVIAGAAKPVEAVEIKEEKMERAANLGEHFAAYVKERGHEKSFHLVAPAYEVRAATDIHTAPDVTDYDRNVIVPPLNTGVLDLFTREVIEGNAITYFVQGAMEGAPAVTAEGAVKPQVHFPKDPKTVSLKKIAGIIKESDELIDDARWLASVINGRLINELNRVRQATVITDLLATSGLGTDTVTGSDAADIADTVHNAMMTVMEDTGFEADGVIMTPTLWHILNVGKDNGDSYYGDGYFRAPMARSIWGIPVAVNSAMTANHIVVGSFKGCASLVGKAEGVTVESTNTDTDDFQRNLMTLRAEVREVVCVRQPSGFINITVGA